MDTIFTNILFINLDDLYVFINIKLIILLIFI